MAAVLWKSLFVFLLLKCTFVEGRGLCWTDWINKYTSSEGIDNEVMSMSELLFHGACLRPYAVDVQRLDGKDMVARLDCMFNGCQCDSSRQRPGVYCSDYKIRFLCPCSELRIGLRAEAGHLVCQHESAINITCPSHGLITVTSVFRGVIWFSSCGLQAPGTHCHANGRNALQRQVEAVCNGKSSCTLTRESLQSNHVDACDGLRPQHLLVSVQCGFACMFEGQRKASGSVFVSRDCHKKCHCLHDGHVVCHRLCPRLEYANCSANGAVLRFNVRPSKEFPQCNCYNANCAGSDSDSCFFNGLRRQRDERFNVGCAFDCRCHGSDGVQCKPLCPSTVNEVTCTKRGKEEIAAAEARYPPCKCPRSPMCAIDGNNSIVRDRRTPLP